MNRNVLNISIFRVGSQNIFYKCSPYPHTKSHLIVTSLWALILHQKESLNVDPLRKQVLGLGCRDCLLIRAFGFGFWLWDSFFVHGDAPMPKLCILELRTPRMTLPMTLLLLSAHVFPST